MRARLKHQKQVLVRKRLEIGDWRRINTEGYEGEDTESKKEAEAPFFL